MTDTTTQIEGEKKPSNQSAVEPKIYKEEEFNLMIELIENGLWRNVNLTKALHVAESTIIEWKKRPEAQNAHRKAILKFIKRRTDAEKILKELDMEVDPDIGALIQNNFINLTDEQLRQLIAAKTRQLGIVVADSGNGEAEEGKSAQLPDAA